MRSRRRRSADDQLAELLRVSKTVSPGWRTSSATIALPGRAVTSGGVTWLVHFHVYGMRLLLTRASKVEFTCGFTVGVSKRLTPRQRARLRRDGWYARVRDRLRRLGYSGDWERAPFGPFAHFTKRVRSINEVPLAVAALDSVTGAVEGPSNKKMQQTRHG